MKGELDYTSGSFRVLEFIYLGSVSSFDLRNSAVLYFSVLLSLNLLIISSNLLIISSSVICSNSWVFMKFFYFVELNQSPFRLLFFCYISAFSTSYQFSFKRRTPEYFPV